MDGVTHPESSQQSGLRPVDGLSFNETQQQPPPPHHTFFRSATGLGHRPTLITHSLLTMYLSNFLPWPLVFLPCLCLQEFSVDKRSNLQLY